MGVWMIIVAGIATFGNIWAIKFKLENERYADAFLDGLVLGVLGWLFSGTISGLAIATIASAIMSVALLVSPPKLDFIEENQGI